MKSRQAVMKICGRSLLSFLQGTSKVIAGRIPDRARLINIYALDSILYLTLEDESFPEIEDGELLTVLIPPLILHLPVEELAHG